MQQKPTSGRPASGDGGGRSNVQSGGGKRKSRQPRKRSGKRGLVWLLFVSLFAVVCVVVGYLLVILNGERILSENVNKLNLDEASIIVDRNGKQVGKLSVAEGNREIVPIGDIPELVQKAFVATEDKRFYEHSGVDLIGIGRALVKDVIHRSAKEGASTITQQVARNLFLNADKTIFRKGTEASIALALERHKSKDEILELYLNRIYFGKGQYGIKTAAKFYFNKDITSKDPKQQLDIWEVATLAALPKAPSTYNPVANPEKSKERRAVVLSLMQEQGLITAEEAAAAKLVDYNPDVVPKSSQQYQSYLDYVVDEAKAVTDLSEEELLSGGYTIKVAMDTKAQQAMEDAFKNDKNFEKSKDEIKMQGAMVIMDQHDGSLVAMVGGRDYEKQGWNRVTKARQPGSSFKPIATYGPAIETGNYFPWSVLRDDKVCYNNGKYCPTDSNKVKYIGPVEMTQAIKESRNQPAVWLLNEIGVSKGLAFAEKLGIELDKTQDRNLAIALGGLTYGASPLQMARAYGAFANGGKLQDPHSILSITSGKGKTIYEYKQSKPKQVMSQTTAYYVTQIMQSVTQPGGTGTRAKISGRAVAGKTGTTQHGIKGLKTSGNRDVWFVGYTPEYTAAVWMGYDSTDKNHLVLQSSGQAAALFSYVMTKALAGKKKLSFPVPNNVMEKEPTIGVTGLTATYVPESVSVDLTWGVTQAKAGTKFKVFRKSETDSTFALISETEDLALEDYAILPDQTYTYYVIAYDPETKQESEPSGQASVKIASELETLPPSPSPQPGEGEDGGGLEEGDGGVGGEPLPPSPTPSESPPPSPSPGGGEPPAAPASATPSPSPSP